MSRARATRDARDDRLEPDAEHFLRYLVQEGHAHDVERLRHKSRLSRSAFDDVLEELIDRDLVSRRHGELVTLVAPTPRATDYAAQAGWR